MGKQPSFQWYPADWLGDVELQAASTTTRGVWINALNRMFGARERGKLVGTISTLARLCNCGQLEFEQFIEEAETLGFCYTSRDPNGILTVINRRMEREGKEKELNRLRQKRHYDSRKPNGPPNGDSDGNLTLPSSSSVSSSPPVREKRTPSPTPPITVDNSKNTPGRAKDKAGSFQKNRGAGKESGTAEEPEFAKTEEQIITWLNSKLTRLFKDQDPIPQIQNHGAALLINWVRSKVGKQVMGEYEEFGASCFWNVIWWRFYDCATGDHADDPIMKNEKPAKLKDPVKYLLAGITSKKNAYLHTPTAREEQAGPYKARFRDSRTPAATPPT